MYTCYLYTNIYVTCIQLLYTYRYYSNSALTCELITKLTLEKSEVDGLVLYPINMSTLNQLCSWWQ